MNELERWLAESLGRGGRLYRAVVLGYPGDTLARIFLAFAPVKAS